MAREMRVIKSHQFEIGGEVASIAWSPLGRRFVIAARYGEESPIYSTANWAKVGSFSQPTGALPFPVAITLDEKNVVYPSVPLGPNTAVSLLVEDPNVGTPLKKVLGSPRTSRAPYGNSPTYLQIAGTSGTGIAAFSPQDHKTTICEFNSRWENTCWVYPGEVTALSLVENGAKIIVGNSDGFIELWNRTERHKEWAINTGTAPIADVALSSDGKTALSGDGPTFELHLEGVQNREQVALSGAIKLWDVATKREVKRIPINPPATGLAFSNRGDWFVAPRRPSGAGSSIYSISRVGSFEERIDLEDIGSLIDASFSPNGEWLAIAGAHKVQIYSISSEGKQ